MTQTAIPIRLATRIADVTSKEFQRHAIFTIPTDSTSPKRIFSTFRADIKRMGDSAVYKLAWFRCDNFITVLVSGTTAVTSYVFAFIVKGKQRKLFESSEVVFEGVSTLKFKIEAEKLLQQYAAPSVKHSFGGTN
ncbi:hypothetical protein ACKUFS_15640 [Pseudomonas cannabina]|uniref:Uncharacterized protein n=3 Tax=Pseudomonas syringae group TaxID=136849 RepID=A0A3M3S6H8_PSECA|nr:MULTISPECIES: hypothetical protein [Pseudomonas syringae group]KPW16058.1 hypothetical protein ALO83_103533 [Pseudomonas cannabina pv. alisalensis]MBM0140001.1 hypothetical protein [Pseudomonas cannabina pv. alisalensis]QHE98646.1 hypothetical protein PMA4326_020000 [Pseudomonas syringae pv. maculicola str. ES4326]QQN20866.1 hypothetical protein JGS08_19980 [Pseudomonas cannabina pv. alisalensis]RMN83273.1 hypothetical protein ALQ52_104177 [Pseudomonas cannabina pv. alisalensis]